MSTTKFLLLIVADSVFSLFQFVNVPHFPLKIEFLKPKNSETLEGHVFLLRAILNVL